VTPAKKKPEAEGRRRMNLRSYSASKPEIQRRNMKCEVMRSDMREAQLSG